MSDKVKLIIELPKYYLEHPQDYTCLAECVRRGTPLDDIKAEIKRMEYHMIDCDVLVSQEEVLEIIDNIGKESEEGGTS